MGCNQGKSADINKSQERSRQPPQEKKSPQQHTASKSIGVADQNKPDPAAFNLGKSYTDEREAETDYFKKIIDNTASNLIDVSTTVAHLESIDVVLRQKDYKKSVQIGTAKVNSTTLNALPSASNNTAAILSHITLTEADNELIKMFS
eukprot:CAMPEP_0168548090 /NCGR_PEP_ID=MMETSP0413-20121227/4378_1 /TAXON_ID=136452 /ORGANISM="Filamoeba nolandi, Strain NC-AS-23-1" /LENGTH=147 /DNA_ID=CAMNT_0008578375 /DNA_START=49 /DNA_END=489 /DNA_ORIENTATION=+